MGVARLRYVPLFAPDSSRCVAKECRRKRAVPLPCRYEPPFLRCLTRPGLSMQAMVHFVEGRFSEALRFVEDSSVVLRRASTPNWFMEHINANVATGSWLGLGDFALAARSSERSLELIRNAVSEKSSFYILGLFSKASVLAVH